MKRNETARMGKTAETVSLQVRIPVSLRNDADSILENIGLDMASAIRVYLKKIVKTKRIPFDLSVEEEPVAEIIPVDGEIQAEMDEIGEIWKQKQKEKSDSCR